MKYLYLLNYTDTVAADSEEQAIETWENIIGESITDYPDMDIQQIEPNKWVSIWFDAYCQNTLVSKMASRWAREAECPDILCSTEF